MATKVKLTDGTNVLPFNIERAQRMIKIGGWQLKDTKFKLKDGVITRNHTAKAEPTKAESAD